MSIGTKISATNDNTSYHGDFGSAKLSLFGKRFLFTEAKITTNDFLHSIMNNVEGGDMPANDLVPTLEPDARSGYHFSEFHWHSNDIPWDFTRDARSNIHFTISGVQHSFFLPHKNSKDIYDALILDIIDMLDGLYDRDFIQNNLRQVAFYGLQEDGRAYVRFFLFGKKYSFLFDLKEAGGYHITFYDDLDASLDFIIDEDTVDILGKVAQVTHRNFQLIQGGLSDKQNPSYTNAYIGELDPKEFTKPKEF